MVENIRVTHGNIEGSTYVFLSTEQAPTVTSKSYGLSDNYIRRMIYRRKTCKVPPRIFVPSPWTKWLQEKNKNS